MSFKAQFGGSFRKDDLERAKKSKHWKGKSFQNLIETTMDFSFSGMYKLMKDNRLVKTTKGPKENIPVLAFDKEAWEADVDQRAKFIWYGHSVLLIQLAGKNILVDPMFGQDASPIAPITTSRFSAGMREAMHNLPEIDLICLTHDHYDHLDYDSIRYFFGSVKHWLVPLGVGRHLENWGLPADSIEEVDWWDSTHYFDIKITFTPSRHFSGRGLLDRAKSLWGGFIFQWEEVSIYHSGDGGYGPHFKEIGEEYGPFDLMFVECGQYYEQWANIHMYPEESVQAALDAKAKMAFPIHWGGFSLAPHTWTDPIERFLKAAIEENLMALHPEIGQIVNLSNPPEAKRWWENIK